MRTTGLRPGQLYAPGLLGNSWRQTANDVVNNVALLAQPTITVAPPGERTARHGDTVVISCEAPGIPTPLIVWRLNFGHVGDAPRVTYSTDKEPGRRPGSAGVGRGQITIRQARAEDEGAYTCEAINSKGNVFAVPDTVLHVTRQLHFFVFTARCTIVQSAVL